MTHHAKGEEEDGGGREDGEREEGLLTEINRSTDGPLSAFELRVQVEHQGSLGERESRMTSSRQLLWVRRKMVVG